jgi:hypothetical protein
MAVSTSCTATSFTHNQLDDDGGLPLPAGLVVLRNNIGRRDLQPGRVNNSINLFIFHYKSTRSEWQENFAARLCRNVAVSAVSYCTLL